MPLRFSRFDHEILITGEAGDFYFLSIEDFDKLLSEKSDASSQIYKDLKSLNFIADDDLMTAVNMTSTRYRSKKAFLTNFTTLHMMVVTVRCNHKCKYCQVSCEDENAKQYDMSPEIAKKVVDLAFKSPSKHIKIEFQGGEPLLNWIAVQAATERANKLQKKTGKELEIVICTNLTLMNEEKLNFIKENNILISTSLDGPQNIHDKFRVMRDGSSSYSKFLDKLSTTRTHLGHDRVGALMTTTPLTLKNIRPIIDDYIKLEFDGIFLRSLNPYGFASELKNELQYSMDEFVEMYKNALEYIITLNKNGTRFVEYYTTLLLKKILTPFSTSFVDLQSPSGAGISGVIYDYNGNIYPADEARMLSRMGDDFFLMGNVDETYSEVFGGKVLKNIVVNSCLEIMPVCGDCVYLPYCGADPIRNYLETKDIIGDRPSSPFCKKHKLIFKYLFEKIKQNEKETMDIFWSWITNRNCSKNAQN